MALVPDASVVIARALGEAHPDSLPVLARIEHDEWIVPALWWFEVRNALIVNERRRRLREHETARILRDLSRVALTVDRSPDDATVMTLARKHRLTVYDAAYLELALREGAALATLDAALAEAASAEAVPLVGADAG